MNHHQRGLEITTIGGPTALVEIDGLRLLTDPTFDGPGEYPMGAGYSLVKQTGPTVSPEAIGTIDTVLLSHDQHPDNLDNAGRLLLAPAGRVLTTEVAATRLAGGNVTGLAPWATETLDSPAGRTLLVTALPAQHGPDDSHHLLGPVIGFRIEGDGVPSVYFSGDNASLAVVENIRDGTGPVDVAVLCIGAARTPRLGDALLTLSGADAVRAAQILEARTVVAVHCDGWQHFSEGQEAVLAAFAGAGSQMTLAPHGHGTPIGISTRS